MKTKSYRTGGRKPGRCQEYEREKLLLQIYKQLVDDQELAALLHKQLKAYRSIEKLQVLLDVIGEDKRDDVIISETADIYLAEVLKVAMPNF